MKTLDFISLLLHNSKTAEPIENKSDYTRVKNWVKKATALYIVFTVIELVVVSAFLGLILYLSEFSLNIENLFFCILLLPIGLIATWGFATMILNFRILIKSMWSSVVSGYHTGEQFQSTRVDVTHEYGNTYKVRTSTDNEGCLFAVIFGFMNWIAWSFLCMCVCPYLTFKKINISKKNLKKFESSLT